MASTHNNLQPGSEQLSAKGVATFAPIRNAVAATPDRRVGAPEQHPPRLRPLAEVREINERCIEFLQKPSRDDDDSCAETLVSPLRNLLSGLSGPERGRAAERAFLLVDLQLSDREYWHGCLARLPKPDRRSRRTGFFPREVAIPLCRSTLILCWHTTRTDLIAARVMLGMSAQVCARIANLKLGDLDRIAQFRWPDLRPRWDKQPELWRQLLMAAQSPSVSLAREIDLRGLQMITGALIGTNGSPA